MAGGHHILSLEPKVVPLQEVVVQWVDPYKLLKEMGRQREQNYSHSPAYLTTFYREGVLLKNKVQNLTEAVFKVYKIATHPSVSDQVKLLKMSRLSNVEAKDNRYIVFVIYNKKFDFKDVPTLPEFYIVPSKYVVENRTKYDLKSGGERFNIFKKDIKDYINRWDLLKKR